jgi:uncharacterized BrkB/YihY/UPF0761 family membrane protein
LSHGRSANYSQTPAPRDRVFALGVLALDCRALSYQGIYCLPEAALQIAGSVASFAVIALLFAMMFKWLPDAQVAWRDVWLGAILTAALFEVGKSLIGLYIGKQGLESTYGAAASIVVVLIWVYYSAQLVLMGVEFTNVYVRLCSQSRLSLPVPGLQNPASASPRCRRGFCLHYSRQALP